jgi:hypothetical protein
VEVLEGQVAVNTGTVHDADGDTVTLSASAGTVVYSGDDTWSWSFLTSDGPAESQTLTISADDGNGGLSETTFGLTVSNVPPTVGVIAVPQEPVPLGTPVGVGAIFSDPAGAADEVYGCTMNYGDGSGESPGMVSGMTCTGTDYGYAYPGVYVVSVTISDKDGGSGSAQASEYVVIYDPDGGFVTGGGWIWSEVGWCELDEACASAEGKANFGFVSRYKKGAIVPTGNTEFNFKAGNLNFHSSSYDWLVVTGNDSAKFKGSGTINGEGEYRFMLWAGDGDSDTFRIRIWEEDQLGNETDIYDNGFDQEIGGGSIVVHTKK